MLVYVHQFAQTAHFATPFNKFCFPSVIQRRLFQIIPIQVGAGPQIIVNPSQPDNQISSS